MNQVPTPPSPVPPGGVKDIPFTQFRQGPGTDITVRSVLDVTTLGSPDVFRRCP